QPQLPRMGHHDARGQGPEQVVEMTVAAAGLEADLEAVGQSGEGAHQVLDAAHLRAKDDLALLVEGTDGDPLGVSVETNVKHETPPKAEERDNQRPWFHVTRPTEASFIVSPRSDFGRCGRSRLAGSRCAQRSGGPTRARPWSGS